MLCTLLSLQHNWPSALMTCSWVFYCCCLWQLITSKAGKTQQDDARRGGKLYYTLENREMWHMTANCGSNPGVLNFTLSKVKHWKRQGFNTNYTVIQAILGICTLPSCRFAYLQEQECDLPFGTKYTPKNPNKTNGFSWSDKIKARGTVNPFRSKCHKEDFTFYLTATFMILLLFTSLLLMFIFILCSALCGMLLQSAAGSLPSTSSWCWGSVPIGTELSTHAECSLLVLNAWRHFLHPEPAVSLTGLI